MKHQGEKRAFQPYPTPTYQGGREEIISDFGGPSRKGRKGAHLSKRGLGSLSCSLIGKMDEAYHYGNLRKQKVCKVFNSPLLQGTSSEKKDALPFYGKRGEKKKAVCSGKVLSFIRQA